jgi:hypothetical protein
MSYRYTVTKSVDDYLAGIPGKLVMMFEEGSAIEITAEDIVMIDSVPVRLPTGDYVNYSYEDGRHSCDCYGDLQSAVAFNIVCYEPEDDFTWQAGSKLFKDWSEALVFFLTHYRDRIELIEAISEGAEDA